ncbi:MAG TPA: flavin-dependent oxidoreductase [Burkholderiaceae bacterium]|jgi:2-polyprenyl-6-methoxyphenol hydroxylase-like FAD-dependent oxidoreductase|nr:flavin-dependent oxidoreductase [Burkholderiaceae bacterium]
MKIIIIGGGIGGLTLGLMLKAQGIDAQVFESAAQVRPLGVGINVQPSAIVELAALGLLPQLDALGVRTAEVCYFNRHGQRIWSEPRGLAAGYRVPQFSIHRGELQMLLMQVALERLGASAVRCGQEAVAVDPDAARVTLLDRQSGQTHVERADAIISADGIHSAVRRQFYPNEGPPRYSGRVLWRATTVGKPFLTGASMVMAGHADQKLVTYPISRRHADRGESLINWIAELKVPGDTPPKGDWNKEVALDVFAGPFEAWRWDWLDVPALFRAASTYYEFPMVDRDPLPRWTHGRITLLGDAGHPMYPIGSNGATQAILDARSLVEQIAGSDVAGLPAALQRYQDDRLPKTARIVMANRAQGPDHVMQVFEERAPEGFERVHDVASQVELEEIARGYKQIVGLDIESVNARAQALGLA